MNTLAGCRARRCRAPFRFVALLLAGTFAFSLCRAARAADTILDTPQAPPESTGSGLFALNSPADKSAGNNAARFASGTGTNLFVVGGTLLPLLQDGKNGTQHSLRTADAVLTSTLITEALKRVVRAPRPDNPAGRDSFPSGHATAAFAVATMQSHFHPKQAPFWYLGAAAIAYSRVKLRRHRTKDVAAGAAVGYFTAKLELRRPRGLILAPFIRPSRKGGSGLAFSTSF